MDDTERTSTVRENGPKCPDCDGPMVLVSEGPKDGQRPWWCPDCDVEVEPALSYTSTDRIKFADELVPKVLNEAKNATVRYDGYEDVQVGDTLTAVTEEGAPFAELTIRRTASVLAVEAHSVLDVFGADYPSTKPQDVIDALNQHYETSIRPETTVQVLLFEVTRDV